MKGKHTSTYQDLLASFEKLDSLLKKFGIPTKSSRLHQAATLVEELNGKLNKLNKKERYLELGGASERYLYSLWELSEIKHIMESADGFDKRLLKNKLKKIVKGTFLLKDGSAKSNDARNTMFELTLASDLARSGYKVALGNENPDIRVDLPTKNYLFECKRVFSERKIEKLIREARKQLEKQLRGEKNCFGAIALSVQRIYVGKGEKLMADSFKDAIKLLEVEMMDFVHKNKRLWKNITNKRIVAIIFHISCPALIKEINRTTAVTYYTRSNIHDDDSFDVFQNDFRKLPKVEDL